jgi:hypothetical protein
MEEVMLEMIIRAKDLSFYWLLLFTIFGSNMYYQFKEIYGYVL